jgi:hypothetical protein
MMMMMMMICRLLCFILNDLQASPHMGRSKMANADNFGMK